jgi:hypothetical protein
MKVDFDKPQSRVQVMLEWTKRVEEGDLHPVFLLTIDKDCGLAPCALQLEVFF